MRRLLSAFPLGCGALAIGLTLLAVRESPAQPRGLRGGSLRPQMPVPVRPPGYMKQPGMAADGLLNPFSPQSGGFVKFNGSSSSVGTSSFATGGSPSGAVSPYGAYGAYGGMNPYASFSPYSGMNPYAGFNPYGGMNPYAGFNPYMGMNPYGGMNPLAPFNPAAAGMNPMMGFNPFGF